MKHQVKFRKNEKGNVLFLILIAVALFAALSYAVTQSTRSGGGSADREQTILSSASLTQGPASLRTSLIRMILSGSDAEDMYFDTPANFAAVSDQTTLVFHPTGGGALYQQAPADMMAGAGQGTWSYNANFRVPQLGIEDDVIGNDVIAFLPGVTRGVCSQINDEFTVDVTGCTNLRNANIPLLDVATPGADIADNHLSAENFPTGAANVLQGEGCTAFSGQPSACFYYDNSGTDTFVFYSTLLER